MDTRFWRGKRVLVTGHTGFKGGWLTLWLEHLGARLCGIALPPATQPNLFELAQVGAGMESYFADIRDAAALAARIGSFAPEIVFHLAAQPLVRASYREPLATWASNLMGTVHLLDVLRQVDSVRVAVVVTTDKVYRNREWPYPYREEDPLGGHDPYSASKAASELAIASYRAAFFEAQGVAVASARAGNVIGGGDWAEDRLIPDAIRAWQAGQPLRLRCPNAIRPWQHVLDPLYGYLTLAERLWQRPELADAYNFGPLPHEVATVQEVAELARQAYGAGEIIAEAGVDGLRETGTLTLETAKSREVLGLLPRWSLAEAVSRTMAWYRAVYQGRDARALCFEEIAAFLDHEPAHCGKVSGVSS
ncbi:MULTISPECIES: CDP-glucose 4,6-dehydratase [unclassified Thermosynechococcus]|uniref:CDP-glucose 4,6-dehydratase n=1 Tax=unclassified Thermosynechococcus TaxID=2622553 RepID=UPI0028F3FFEC|nr:MULTISPECIES: CDP-glucose 4,6-dehydratase [unclassified Thermosynechococcus]